MDFIIIGILIFFVCLFLLASILGSIADRRIKNILNKRSRESGGTGATEKGGNQKSAAYFKYK